MADLTHLDLNKKLDTIHSENQADHLRLMKELAEMKLDLSTTVQVNCVKIANLEVQSTHAFEDIHKLEDKAWKASGAVVAGSVALIAAVGSILITMLGSCH